MKALPIVEGKVVVQIESKFLLGLNVLKYLVDRYCTLLFSYRLFGTCDDGFFFDKAIHNGL